MSETAPPPVKANVHREACVVKHGTAAVQVKQAALDSLRVKKLQLRDSKI